MAELHIHLTLEAAQRKNDLEKIRVFGERIKNIDRAA